jgi:hypothetical protein
VNTSQIFAKHQSRTALVLAAALIIALGASVAGWLAQRDMGRVRVTNVGFDNWNGIPIRAKLLQPVEATASSPLPGAVYIHGYQNNRETSQLTGRIYLGAVLNAALVAWMFTSSQVIAPIPV